LELVISKKSGSWLSVHELLKDGLRAGRSHPFCGRLDAFRKGRPDFTWFHALEMKPTRTTLLQRPPAIPDVAFGLEYNPEVF